MAKYRFNPEELENDELDMYDPNNSYSTNTNHSKYGRNEKKVRKMRD